jgi:DNA repair protein RadC
MNIVSEIKLTYVRKVKNQPQITSSDSAYNVLRENWDNGVIDLKEEFKVLILNRANKVQTIYPVSNGGTAGTIVDMKLIFAATLLNAGSAIILCHNHPSGSLTPSSSDIELTKKIKKAGELLDINVLDHIIITSDSYYSFANEGLI